MQMGKLRDIRGGSERGANLVEFAILLPLLLLLVLGIVELGWKFSQFNDVRHGAREGARFAAVSAGDNGAIGQHVCDSMDAISAGMTSINVTLDDGSGDAGGTGTIQVQADVTSLTGAPLITIFLPTTLTSDLEFRLEQPSSLGGWGPGTVSC